MSARSRGAAERARIERGDWQTPIGLAEAVVDLVACTMKSAPKTVLEPTCGRGAFLVAAARRFRRADLHGFEIDARHARHARAALAGSAPSAATRARVTTADFFELDWPRVAAETRGPILVVGNPPWVTSAQLGVLGSSNLPVKHNARRLAGLDAMTGKSNFDVSEWMIANLLAAFAGRDATLAMLCKAAVARRIVETVAEHDLDVSPVGLWRIDAAEHFGASVSAVLFVAKTQRVARRSRAQRERVWPVHADLASPDAESAIGVVDGALVADSARFARTRHLAGDSDPEWRSGVKHDCARVMELKRTGAGLLNGLGERVDLEHEVVFAMLKSSDVANRREAPSRAMVVPQRALGEDTLALRRRAPRTWKYLSRHRALLDARKSSIYAGQPPFAIFGVGPYSFAPWKVAVSGLYKRAVFTVVGPHEGRPVVLDDTCYFLPFETEVRARRAAKALASAAALDFLAARVFWDAKRPITKTILQALDLRALERGLPSS